MISIVIPGAHTKKAMEGILFVQSLVVQGHNLVARDSREQFIDRPDAASEDFTRGIDLDG